MDEILNTCGTCFFAHRAARQVSVSEKTCFFAPPVSAVLGVQAGNVVTAAMRPVVGVDDPACGKYVLQEKPNAGATDGDLEGGQG